MTKQVPMRLFQLSVASVIMIVASTAAAQGGGVSVEVNVGSASPLDQQLRALSDPNPATRLDAARALGELGDTAAVAPLVRVARGDPRPEVRGWALRSLQQLGTPEALATIREVAESDTDERVRALGNQLAAAAPAAPVPASAPAEAAAPVPAGPAPAPAVTQPAPAASATVVVQQPGAVQGQAGGVVMPQQVGGQPDFYTLRLQRRAGRGLRVGGWIVFGTTYFISLMAGIGMTASGESDDGWPLFIPGVGPFITAARLLGDTSCDGDVTCRYDEDNDVGGAFSILAGLLQIGGIAMLAAGYARRARVMRQGVASERRRGRNVAFLPAGPGDGPGVSLAAVF